MVIACVCALTLSIHVITDNNHTHLHAWLHAITGCLPIFEDRFSTFFETFKTNSCGRPVYTMNDQQLSGNEASAATQLLDD